MFKQQEHLLPLCVDLDGTLVYSDTLWELFIRALKTCPWILFLLPFFILRGKSHLKYFLFKRCGNLVNTLPFNNKLLEYLKIQKSEGRKIYLVTASNQDFAKNIVSEFDIFDDVFGSNERLNLRGKNKAKFLTEKFGSQNFAYAGNDNTDLEVWKDAGEVIVVNASNKLAQKVKEQNLEKPITIISLQKSFNLKSFFKLIRVHQWAKNLLIFVPLVMSHTYQKLANVENALLAFFALSFCASATYIFNDILDVENDRKHRTKKFRPLASGIIPLPNALCVMFVLFTCAISISLNVSLALLVMLFVYSVITLSYSFIFKRIIILDILILALLYMFRIYFGAVAISDEISFWLVSFSIFIFFSLGALKRYVEVSANKDEPTKIIGGRGYTSYDAEFISMIGIGAGMMSVLTYIMYIDAGANALYESPVWLMFGCLPILYFISKIWLMAKRSKVHDDPVVYAIKTKENYLILFIFAVLFFMSKPIIQ